ncbi:MAG: acyl-ACP--UDP-N-acetylglucosamine O-acyltransferase [Candidatus Omnitrophota bacterium]
MSIHATAIVSKKARIGKDVEIGPWSIIEDDVLIGDGTKLWQNVYVASGTTIGANNVIYMGAVLGHEPQHTAYKGEPRSLKIGNNNTIREYVTIHRSFAEGASTVIGNGNYFMATSHVAHDCVLGNDIVLCNAALLGGHVEVENKVFMGGGAAAHQFTRIGTLAMIGGLTRVTQDVVPYTLLECDAEVCGLNLVGLRRSGFGPETRKQIKEAFNILYREGLSIPSALKRIQAIPKLFPEVKHMVEFIERSKRGICSHRRQAGTGGTNNSLD